MDEAIQARQVLLWDQEASNLKQDVLKTCDFSRSAFVENIPGQSFTSVLQSYSTMSLMNETSADLSMACSPDIWELKMFLWTSADMIAWNDVLLEMIQVSGVAVEPAVVS